MEKVRAIVQDHCKGIEKVLREENIYWKEIQSVIEQYVLTKQCKMFSCINLNVIHGAYFIGIRLTRMICI